jgi:hypothetical protein
MGYKIYNQGQKIEFTDFTSRFIKAGLTDYLCKELSDELIEEFLNTHSLRLINPVFEEPFPNLSKRHVLMVKVCYNHWEEIGGIYPEPKTNILYTVTMLDR